MSPLKKKISINHLLVQHRSNKIQSDSRDYHRRRSPLRLRYNTGDDRANLKHGGEESAGRREGGSGRKEGRQRTGAEGEKSRRRERQDRDEVEGQRMKCRGK